MISSIPTEMSISTEVGALQVPSDSKLSEQYRNNIATPGKKK